MGLGLPRDVHAVTRPLFVLLMLAQGAEGRACGRERVRSAGWYVPPAAGPTLRQTIL